MPHLTRHELSVLDAVADMLRALRPDADSPWPEVVATLKAATGADFISLHRPAIVAGAADLEFAHQASPVAGMGDRFREFVRAVGAPAFTFDLVRPAPEVRDRVLCVGDGFRSQEEIDAHPFTPFARRAGFRVEGQVRVLVCDGPVLLGWFGGAWPPEALWRGRQVVGRLTPVVRARLLWDRAFRFGDLAWTALQASLDAQGRAAFLVRCARGALSVELCNAPARLMLDAAPGETLAGLRAACEGRTDAKFETRPVVVNGLGDTWLALARPRPAHEERVAAAAARWHLTPRQRQVLSLVALGHTNRTISELLCCAEGTVELHVSAMLDKVGADNRAQLVARVWMNDR